MDGVAQVGQKSRRALDWPFRLGVSAPDLSRAVRMASPMNSDVPNLPVLDDP
jgi:hypothetical protein